MDIEKAKKLLKLAIETGDDELIDMANELISKRPTTQKSVNNKKDQTDVKNDFIFKMNNENEQSTVRRGTPVNEVRNRVNKFIDDGIEAKDIETPDIRPTERKRPAFKMIQQTCSRCNKTVDTHPTHQRDFYICDKCLKK